MIRREDYPNLAALADGRVSGRISEWPGLKAEARRLFETAADGMPLRATVEGGRLVISIGVDTLAFAFENGEENNPFNEQANDFERQLRIADPLQFAEDVCRELNDEAEDGSTPFTRFFDSMMEAAVENGSLGIEDSDETADGTQLEKPAPADAVGSSLEDVGWWPDFGVS
jgi:hypothetical protein